MMADGTNMPLCDFEIAYAELTLKPSISLIEEETELVLNNLPFSIKLSEEAEETHNLIVATQNVSKTGFIIKGVTDESVSEAFMKYLSPTDRYLITDNSSVNVRNKILISQFSILSRKSFAHFLVDLPRYNLPGMLLKRKFQISHGHMI